MSTTKRKSSKDRPSNRATDASLSKQSKQSLEDDRERRRRAREMVERRRQQRRSGEAQGSSDINNGVIPARLGDPTHGPSSSHKGASRSRRRLSAEEANDIKRSNHSQDSHSSRSSGSAHSREDAYKRSSVNNRGSTTKNKSNKSQNRNSKYQCDDQQQSEQLAVDDKKRKRRKQQSTELFDEVGSKVEHETDNPQSDVTNGRRKDKDRSKYKKAHQTESDDGGKVSNPQSDSTNHLKQEREKRKQKLEKVKSDIMQRMNKLSEHSKPQIGGDDVVEKPIYPPLSKRNSVDKPTTNQEGRRNEQSIKSKRNFNYSSDDGSNSNSDVDGSIRKLKKEKKSKKKRDRNGKGSSIAGSSTDGKLSRSDSASANVTLDDLNIDKWAEDSRRVEEPSDFLAMHDDKFNQKSELPTGEALDDEETLNHLKRVHKYNLSWMPEGKRFLYIVSAGVVLVLVAIIVFVVLVLGREDSTNGNNAPSTQAPTDNNAPTAAPTAAVDGLLPLLSEISVDGGDAIDVSSSPQQRAYTWLLGNANLGRYTRVEKIQRYVLSTLYYSTSGEAWENDFRWLSNEDECSWHTSEEEFPICNLVGELDELDLNNNNLQGTLPWAELSLLKDRLLVVDVLDNNIGGILPPILGEMTSLVVLDLFSNKIESSIPTEIGNLGRKLKYVDLDNNLLSGKLPTELGMLQSLETLWLNNNLLTGTVPSELGLNTNLKSLYLAGNMLTGTMPQEICSLNLENLEISCDVVQCDCCTKCE